MNISIGNDHAGVDLKEAIVSHLEQKGYQLYNHGTNSEDSVDYADFIHPVAQDVEDKKSELGIIVCGSGNGAAMTANKHQKIRAALCWSGEISKLSRQHNDANILSIPARFVNLEQALEMVDIFITTPFEGGRHQKRIDKIHCI
jgi:ribose 5-phosphate isomerase B